MKRTPEGTPVGVDDPYEHAGRCDHCTDAGQCRFAAERAGEDPEFAAERRAEGYRCPAVDPEGAWEWRDCAHYRSTTDGRACVRCGLEERRDAHSEATPLLEEHHLSYGDADGHEITVALCRWCHARIHGSFARLADDASPAPEAVAAREGRRSAELREGFSTAAERRDDGGSGGA